MKITILVGLPASGKTTYGKTLGGVFIDDISIKDIDILTNTIDDKESAIIIVDCILCKTYTRNMCKLFLDARARNYEQEWIYFSNNPEACLKNESKRKLDGDLRKASGLIRSLSKEYIIPDGAKVIECYEGD